VNFTVEPRRPRAKPALACDMLHCSIRPVQRSRLYCYSPMSEPVPTEIRLRRGSRLLEVSFRDGSRFELPFEYLRVYSPSAEVKGHGPGQEVLVLGKENVGIAAVEPVGQYAIRLVFDDGHDTGLYTWKYLAELGREQPEKWAHYLARRARALTPGGGPK
jgi:DUF971 family protein